MRAEESRLVDRCAVRGHRKDRSGLKLGALLAHEGLIELWKQTAFRSWCEAQGKAVTDP